LFPATSGKWSDRVRTAFQTIWQSNHFITRRQRYSTLKTESIIRRQGVFFNWREVVLYLHHYALHSYGAWHGRRENCQRRLILHSAAEHYTTEGQEFAILDISLSLDQLTWATVHGRADACIVTRFIKLATPHQWQVSFHFFACGYMVLIDFVLWEFLLLNNLGDIELVLGVFWGVLNLFWVT